MFPVPRVLKEPSSPRRNASRAMSTDESEYHLRHIQNAPGHARFLLNRNFFAEISRIEDRTILEKILSSKFLLCKKRKVDTIQGSAVERRHARSV